MASRGTVPPRGRDDDVSRVTRSQNPYNGPRQTMRNDGVRHDTSLNDPYKWDPPVTMGAEAPDHATAENDPYQYRGGGSTPRALGGDREDGTFNPPGKIGGYVASVPGTKDPAYAVVSGQPPQDWNIGQANSKVEGAPTFASYFEVTPARGPTDFSKTYGDTS